MKMELVTAPFTLREPGTPVELPVPAIYAKYLLSAIWAVSFDWSF
jgi:hypothetical protein